MPPIDKSKSMLPVRPTLKAGGAEKQNPSLVRPAKSPASPTKPGGGPGHWRPPGLSAERAYGQEVVAATRRAVGSAVTTMEVDPVRNAQPSGSAPTTVAPAVTGSR